MPPNRPPQPVSTPTPTPRPSPSGAPTPWRHPWIEANPLNHQRPRNIHRSQQRAPTARPATRRRRPAVSTIQITMRQRRRIRRPSTATPVDNHVLDRRLTPARPMRDTGGVMDPIAPPGPSPEQAPARERARRRSPGCMRTGMRSWAAGRQRSSAGRPALTGEPLGDLAPIARLSFGRR